MKLQPRKFLISGGGTGGHIFPAVAIANALKETYPNCEILFIGASDRMEMEKVPQEGYEIIGLEVAGLKRSLSPHNISVAWKFLKSLFKAKKIIKEFKPDCVIGTGGYASLAVLYSASGMGFPTVIWEGNGYAGLTNKILANRVTTICTGFPGMEQFFPPSKTIYTGNPVRSNMLNLPDKAESARFFGLDSNKPILFITGGSLGARTLNEATQKWVEEVIKHHVQLIWQTGKNFEAMVPADSGIVAMPFLHEMDKAFAAADVVISRAGAISISELAVTTKPAILVPSPNVTDDHQTQNALKLTADDAAILVSDTEARDRMIPEALKLLKDQKHQDKMKAALQIIAKPDATKNIVNEIKKLIEK